MTIKDKILNRLADRLSSYRTPDYDKILCISVRGEVKGVKTTYDCTYQKVLEDKQQEGIISIDKLLNDEFENSNHNTIYFCDKENVICLQNHRKDTYIETVHECFDMGTDVTYIKCNSSRGYQSIKGFVEQSSIYHSYIDVVDEIPYKKAYEDLFSSKEEVNDKVDEKKEEKTVEKNYFEIEGKISSIGKEFTKKDNTFAQFINVEQQYEYNGKTKKNIMSIMLSDDVFEEYKNNLKVNDNVNVKGIINFYKDKNNQDRMVVNCYELEVLNKDLKNDFER